jgi:uncharacterized cupredoxin-like copper-binding protein
MAQRSRKEGPNMRIMLLAATAALATFGLAACGGGGEKEEGGEAAGPPLKTFTVSETEFKLSPSTFTVDKAGTYTFHAVNNGQVVHSLEIEGNGVEKEIEGNLQQGDSGDLTVALEKGTYELYCPVDGHKDQGMEGEVKVAGGGSSESTGSSGGSNGY